MNLLKAIGVALLKGTQILTGIGPLLGGYPKAQQLETVIADDLTKVADVVASIEAVGAALTLTGAQKITAASPLIAQVIMKSELLIGHSIDNATEFQAGCADLGSAVVRIMNSLKSSGLQTQSKT